MNLEQQFLNKVDKIKRSKSQKVDFLKSTILYEIQNLIYDDKSSFEELQEYYNYLYDKLELVSFEAERLIQKEIKYELDKYLKVLKAKILDEGYESIKMEYLHLELQSKLNSEIVSNIPNRKTTKEIADKLNTIHDIEIESINEEASLKNNQDFILNQINNLKTY